MEATIVSAAQAYTTSSLAAATGYSVQQIRDLERLAVIPPAIRQPNGYRRFGSEHVTALRAYRNLAIAVGPVVARSTMREAQTLPYDQAIASIVALHVALARSRDDSIAALQALDGIVEEDTRDAAPTPADSMSISELANAIGVRASTLRFWEQQGLVTPERTAGLNVRHYPLAAIREARIVAALRAGGYRIPAVQAVMRSLRRISDTDDVRAALQNRLRTVASQSEALLRAGTDIADLISR
ncbi:MerR family transcriptional regulator [Nonomuraea dietziae]|uniref:DNA-binding transcriptional MerR regulator n=1 Tax=Nonomuraea dietziae TaxID=65515 RepID=A0A7W5Y7J4_9ACTN|nr:MerR family transcriptional regulator [Nonomuraea dietziae]MBB3727398.1 DNA-binding transcriptional MerR regulator [Nonomuraea dietziae]